MCTGACSPAPQVGSPLGRPCDGQGFDVREQWEYARDHIPSATLVPLGQIIARPQDVIKDDNLVFVCEVGQRSAVAAEMAAALGKTNVFNLEGGMQAWRSAGLPVDR